MLHVDKLDELPVCQSTPDRLDDTVRERDLQEDLVFGMTLQHYIVKVMNCS